MTYIYSAYSHGEYYYWRVSSLNQEPQRSSETPDSAYPLSTPARKASPHRSGSTFRESWETPDWKVYMVKNISHYLALKLQRANGQVSLCCLNSPLLPLKNLPTPPVSGCTVSAQMERPLPFVVWPSASVDISLHLTFTAIKAPCFLTCFSLHPTLANLIFLLPPQVGLFCSII